MGETLIPVGDDRAVKKFSAFLSVQSAGQSLFLDQLAGKEFRQMAKDQQFFGTDPNYPIMVLRDLEKDAGDLISFDVVAQLAGEGVTGDNNREGHEEALTLYSDSLYIDQIWHGVNPGGKMARKRTVHNLRSVGKDRLANWFGRWFDENLVCYAAGFRGDETDQWLTPTTYTGHAGNAFADPDSDHLVLANEAASEAAMDGADDISLSDLDRLVLQLKIMENPPQPVLLKDGEPCWILILHSRCAHTLTTSTTTNDWLDIQKNAGKRGADNPIFKGALGWYKGLIIKEFSKIPTESNDTVYVARNLCLGAQSLVMASGSPGGKFQFNWHEELTNRGNTTVVGADTIVGFNKVTFNSKDHGVVVLSAPSHDVA